VRSPRDSDVGAISAIGLPPFRCGPYHYAVSRGVAALGRQLGLDVDRSGRVAVEPDLSVAGHPDVFVVGDLAVFRTPHGKTLPGIAPVAIQQGQAAAANIWRSIRGQPRRPFHYFDRGTMATIGRAAAVAQIRALHLSGFLAWMAWLCVHIFFLIGFENRLLVIVQWAISYLSYERGARLITGGWHGGAGQTWVGAPPCQPPVIRRSPRS